MHHVDPFLYNFEKNCYIDSDNPSLAPVKKNNTFKLCEDETRAHKCAHKFAEPDSSNFFIFIENGNIC